MTPALARTLNAIGLLGLGAALAVAFLDQFVNRDLPCPLCLLQRVGLTAVGIGIALNVTVRPRPAHYGIAIVSALAGGSVSLRQIELHVIPGSGSYGQALMGLHFYTWAFVAFAVVILGAAAMLFFEKQFTTDARTIPVPLTGLSLAAVSLFTVLALANTISTVAECELGLCPDDPVSYELFKPDAPGIE